MPDSSPLLIVGSVAFDDLHLPSGKFRDVVGGAATYAAFAASLFAPTQVVAVVGEDFPQATLDALNARGVDTAGVQRQPGSTFRWEGRYAADLASRETLDTQLNVFAAFQPTLPDHYRSSRYLLLGNIHPELQLRVLEQVSSPELVAADTMNFWIEQERSQLLEVLKRIDLLVINDEELRLLAQDHNLRRSAQAVLSMGPRRLICKRGDAGAALYDETGVFFSPALALHHECDPTGAGDSFAGALLGRLAESGARDGRALREALQIGTAVASFCVQGVGTQALAELTEPELQERLDELKAMTQLH